MTGFQLVSRWRGAEGGMSREGTEALRTPVPCAMNLFHLAVLSCILYNKLVTVNKLFLSSASHSNKLPNLRRGSWEPLIYSQSVRSTGALGPETGI